MASHSFSYFQLENAQEIEHIYAAFRKNPQSIAPSWRYFFEGMEVGQGQESRYGGDDRISCLIERYRRFGHCIAKTNPLCTDLVIPPELDIYRIGFHAQELYQLFPTYGLLSQSEAPLAEIIKSLEEIYCRSASVECGSCCPQEIVHWIQERVERERFRMQLTAEEKRRLSIN